MKSHSLPTTKTGHYYTLGEPSSSTKHLWIVCHGYGQLASRMIYKFEEVLDEDTYVVAPEGFSRFYFGGFGKPVGASWMTKADRLVEIEDFCNWLDKIYQTIVPTLHEDVTITLFGFSQGVATTFRWMHARQPKIDNIVVWAGNIPEDIEYLPLKDYFSNINKYLAYGFQDEYLSEEFVESIKERCRKQGLEFQTFTFDGKHVIDRPTLKKVGQLIKE